jgi:hypothetical protein
MGKIYVNDGKFYRMVKPVGSWQHHCCRHYALWCPVKKFLGLFWIARGTEFWFPMDGFKKLK